MKWARDNGLHAGFVACMVFGGLVMGYLIYGAYGSYLEIAYKYEMQARELDRLRSLRPYPDLHNLQMEKNRRDALADRIDKLQSTLAAIEIPVIPLTPEQFQDELGRTVSAVAELAAAQGTSLPKDFYLGFQQYRDTLPADRMAAVLQRELEAINLVVCVLLENHITRIVDLEREPRLRAEDASFESISGTQLEADTQESGTSPLVMRHPFLIGFTATQSAFRRALNAIATTPQQYYIVDLLNVANEELAGPSRGVPSESMQDDGFSKKEKIQLIVGDEELNVRLRIQIVDFSDLERNSAGSDEG